MVKRIRAHIKICTIAEGEEQEEEKAEERENF
jgi:hypothetical protein